MRLVISGIAALTLSIASFTLANVWPAIRVSQARLTRSVSDSGLARLVVTVMRNALALLFGQFPGNGTCARAGSLSAKGGCPNGRQRRPAGPVWA
jgi:hypothetical protein